jgi:hypothetical protein
MGSSLALRQSSNGNAKILLDRGKHRMITALQNNALIGSSGENVMAMTRSARFPACTFDHLNGSKV